METGAFERTELPSGLRILTERMPAVRSVALGVWAGVGSRDETPRLSGASHFLEHLLFKGTKRRSARDIAELMDAVGGETNAFTAKEYTCFYARTLDRDLELAVDVVVDMLRFSKLATEDVEAERTVILEEIGMHNDAPDDVVHDLFAEALFGGHPLGRPVLGTAESVGAMSRDAVARYWRRHYVPGNLVVAVAGNCSHEEVVELVTAAFEGAEGEPLGPPPGRRGPRAHRGLQVRRKPTEQAHVVLGTRGLSRSDPRRFALGVLNIAFGGGMSSRLFQEVREKRGLVYSIYSYATQYSETGSFSVYAGTAPKRIHEVLAIVREELDRVIAGGLSEEELERGKGHLKGSLVLGLEDTSGRMTRLGKSEITSGEILSVDDIVRRVDEVTDEDVRAVAKEVLGGGPRALALIGPFDADGFERYIG
ncbi:MAG TPA: pitrilysin family protein [Actinomycetes bacterium]|jgi:predicted Zn-dependent peptidase|nr:pitrilysin family protein [Actinomycetes bacterium]